MLPEGFAGSNGARAGPALWCHAHRPTTPRALQIVGTTPTDRRGDTVIMEGDGWTLMPGLIDAHVHPMMESISLSPGLTPDISCVTLVADPGSNFSLIMKDGAIYMNSVNLSAASIAVRDRLEIKVPGTLAYGG